MQDEKKLPSVEPPKLDQETQEKVLKLDPEAQKIIAELEAGIKEVHRQGSNAYSAAVMLSSFVWRWSKFINRFLILSGKRLPRNMIEAMTEMGRVLDQAEMVGIRPRKIIINGEELPLNEYLSSRGRTYTATFEGSPE